MGNDGGSIPDRTSQIRVRRRKKEFMKEKFKNKMQFMLNKKRTIKKANSRR